MGRALLLTKGSRGGGEIIASPQTFLGVRHALTRDARLRMSAGEVRESEIAAPKSNKMLSKIYVLHRV